jgi:hypothetical protein
MLEAFSLRLFFAIQRRKICEVLMSTELKQGMASIYVFLQKPLATWTLKTSGCVLGSKDSILTS